MRLPRFRLTVRGMMLAVAIAAFATLMGDSLRRLSNEYREKGERFRSMASVMTQGYPGPHGRERQIAYALYLADKYEHASRYPWLPVAPDPPMPQ